MKRWKKNKKEGIGKIIKNYRENDSSEKESEGNSNSWIDREGGRKKVFLGLPRKKKKKRNAR